MTASTFRSILTSDWAWPIEDHARRAAAIVALVIAAGLWAGDQLHRLNDRLAAAYVAMLGLSQASPAVPAVAPVAPAVAPAEPELPELRLTPYTALTVAKLRRMARAAGLPAKQVRLARKAALLAFLTTH